MASQQIMLVNSLKANEKNCTIKAMAMTRNGGDVQQQNKKRLKN